MRKKLRKISISQLIKGHIFNSNTIQNKENNTYSAEIIDEKITGINNVVENRMKKVFSILASVQNPTKFVGTGININGGESEKALLICVHGHTSTENATYAAMYLCRCGFSGNNYSITPIVEDKGGSNVIGVDFAVDSNGQLIYRVNLVRARINIYEI